MDETTILPIIRSRMLQRPLPRMLIGAAGALILALIFAAD